VKAVAEVGLPLSKVVASGTRKSVVVGVLIIWVAIVASSGDEKVILVSPGICKVLNMEIDKGEKRYKLVVAVDIQQFRDAILTSKVSTSGLTRANRFRLELSRVKDVVIVSVGLVERGCDTLPDEPACCSTLGRGDVGLDGEGGRNLVADIMNLVGHGIFATTQRRDENQSEFHGFCGWQCLDAVFAFLEL
jgi:hypothetical protein